MLRISFGSDGARRLEWDTGGGSWPVALRWESPSADCGTRLSNPSGRVERRSCSSFSLRVWDWLEIVRRTGR